MASGLSPTFSFAAGRQRFHVKNADRAFPPVTDKSAAEFWGQCNAVNARSIGDVTYAFAGIGVDHHDVAAARDVDPTRFGVGGQVIPASVAAHFVGCDNVVPR